MECRVQQINIVNFYRKVITSYSVAAISAKWTNIRDRYAKYMKKLQEEKTTDFKEKTIKKYIYSDCLSCRKTLRGKRQYLVFKSRNKELFEKEDENVVDHPDDNKNVSEEHHESLLFPSPPPSARRKRRRARRRKQLQRKAPHRVRHLAKSRYVWKRP